jgi:hypothetical protein
VTRLARLPFQRALDQFGFRFQPSIGHRAEIVVRLVVEGGPSALLAP